MAVGVDIELTNRCNAHCDFCPRDATPHQGLMSREVFDQTLLRAIEHRALIADRLDTDMNAISLCGLGEPLLHRDAMRSVERCREAGFAVSMSSNGALLDERKARALLDAGLGRIYLNVGETGADYEAIYGLPFERTLENVLRFAELAGDACEVWMVLVDHRRDPVHQQTMRDFWSSHGLTRFQEYNVINRGGALFVDHLRFGSVADVNRAQALVRDRDGEAICAVPFTFLFVGYDGQYYLCCSDWTKAAPLGSVFDVSFLEIMGPKLDHVLGGETVCRSCNLDPLNLLTEAVQATDAGEAPGTHPADTCDSIVATSRELRRIIGRISPELEARQLAVPARRRIPVTAL
ncbi:MAG: radical SAM protein [Acidimicrobiales bacterium]|jgi:hypothetical protein|nr:radical SAM protein [Acidimicrobiales bacterium]